MRGLRNFADGFVAEIEERGIEGDRLDVPDARPFDRAALFAGETLAGFASLAEHGGKYVRIEIALIESGFAAADDRGDDPGEGFHAAHRANGVGMLAGDGADFESEFGGRGERVAAGVHGGR